MEEQKKQNYVLALDIGTRSIVGVVGEPVDGRLKVQAVEMAEHSVRTMIDGQIDNIRQVADLARTVVKRLEDRLGKKSFKQLQREGVYSDVARDVIRPSAEECRSNSRATSTKMRWAIKA